MHPFVKRTLFVAAAVFTTLAAASCGSKSSPKDNPDNMEGGSAVKSPTVGGESPEKPPAK